MKLLNIKQTYIYNTSILIYKLLHNSTQSNITFTKNIDIHKREFRKGNHIHLHNLVQTSVKEILFEGALIYNKLPSEIKNAKSTCIFKKKL